MARTKYHKFRGGERCDECGARQWFAQDALRYCRNGHRLEGFANHEADEDAFGTQGKVTRKKKEARRKVAVKLTGDEGRELYLEVVQLVLIRQVRWLVDVQGFPADFTELVKALWTLRVRNLPLRERGRRESRDRAGRDGESDSGTTLSQSQSQSQSQSRSRSQSQALFSSQSETGESSDVDLSDATTATWAPDAVRRWKLPKPIDTLALCYIGCLIRRLPVTAGDFHIWAQRGDIDFLAALNHIPRNARDRLPPEFHRVLLVRDHLPAGRLQATVQQLVTSFKLNFDITVPPLNYVPLIIRLITDLVLPIEVYTTVKYIGEILKADFAYSIGSKRNRTMDNPEVLLTCLVLVSTKLLYSLDGIERPPISQQDPRRIKIDWEEWQKATAEKPARDCRNLVRGEEYKVTADEVLTMAETKLDDYMNWFEAMWIDDGEPKTTERVRNLFIQKGSPSSTEGEHPKIEPENRNDRTKKRYERLNRSMRSVKPVMGTTEDEKTRLGNLCPVWRSEADLPDAAKCLYRKAAELAAIPLATLIRGATQVERQLELWCLRKASKTGKGKGIAKGKGKAIRAGDDSSSEDYF